MTYAEFLRASELSNAEIGRRIGLSRFYLNHIQHGRRALTKGVALKIWREFKVKIGPLEGATDAELRVLGRFEAA